MWESDRRKISNKIAWDYDTFLWNLKLNDDKSIKVPSELLNGIKELVAHYIDSELSVYYPSFRGENKEISIQYLMNKIEPILYTKAPFDYEDYDLIDGDFIFLVATFITNKATYIDYNFDEIKVQIEKENRNNKINELINN